MVFDLAAGAKQRFAPHQHEGYGARSPGVLVFDSGLGGLTVFPEVRRQVGSARLFYAADDAVFPYGRLSEDTLVDRVLAVMAVLMEAIEPDIVVIACNTASTLVLGPLRERWPSVAFVGTVPAIKPAAEASRSRLISVLATPGTVDRAYTRDLMAAYAHDCAVTLVGARRLASLAEATMRAESVSDDAIAAEIAPAFVTVDGRRTDVVVLACTHYPLLRHRLERLAPWPVTWIDPAGAIATRTAHVLHDRFGDGSLPPLAEDARALFTSNRAPGAALRDFLESSGLRFVETPAFASLDRVGR